MNRLVRGVAIVGSGIAFLYGGIQLGENAGEKSKNYEIAQGKKAIACTRWIGEKALIDTYNMPNSCIVLTNQAYIEADDGTTPIDDRYIKDDELKNIKTILRLKAEDATFKAEQEKNERKDIGIITGLSAWLLIVGGIGFYKSGGYKFDPETER